MSVYLPSPFPDPSGGLNDHSEWVYRQLYDIADGFNTLDIDTFALYQVQDFATLRTINPNTDRSIWLRYGSTLGDGEHGLFDAVSGAAALTYTDNGSSVIVPTGGDGSSAWIRVSPGYLHSSSTTTAWGVPAAVPGVVSKAITVTGAAIGDLVQVGTSVVPSSNYVLSGVVTAADTVTAYAHQLIGTAADPFPSGCVLDIGVSKY